MNNTRLMRIAHVGPAETRATQQGGTLTQRTVVVQGIGEGAPRGGRWYGAVALPITGEQAQGIDGSLVGRMCFVNFRPVVAEYTPAGGQTRMIQDFYVSYFQPVDL